MPRDLVVADLNIAGKRDGAWPPTPRGVKTVTG